MLHSNLPSTNQKVGSSSLFRRAIENGYPFGCPFSIYHSSAEEGTQRRVCQERSAKSLRTQAKTLRWSIFNESVAETHSFTHAAASESGQYRRY